MREEIRQADKIYYEADTVNGYVAQEVADWRSWAIMVLVFIIICYKVVRGGKFGR